MSLINLCRFTPTAGGTTDWTYSSAVSGYNSPALAGAVNGATYKVRSESSDLSQWEVSQGVYNSATGTFARTIVLSNSSGTGTAPGQSGAGTKINFSAAPQVAVVALAEDLYPLPNNTTVTGASNTYSLSQIGANVLRSNSGAAMIDTLPGTGSFLPNLAVVTVTNADTAGVLAISAASGALIKGGPTYNGFLYLGPGQCASLQSDGTNYWVLSAPTRAKLAANTTIYVATTGSDTANHGILSTSAFLTTSKAWSFAQSMLDLNGYVLTIQHANGTYSTNTTLQGPMVGQNGAASVILQGDTVTNSNVTWSGTTGVNLTLINSAMCQIQGFTFTNSGGQAVYVGSNAVVNFQSNTCGAISASALASALHGTIRIVGSYTISGGQGVHWNANATGNITIEAASVTITLTGTPAFSTCFAFAQNSGCIFFDFTPTFSGSATGQRWAAQMNGVIQSNATTLPGSVGGVASTGGVYN